MIRVRVAGVALDDTSQHVVLLKPIDAEAGVGLVLPIWIGSLEATSIMVAIEGADVPRPFAHDLMRGLLEATGADLDRVEVTKLEEGTFYAEVVLETPLGTRRVDARPSDAVALASRLSAPILVAERVMVSAGVPDMMTTPEQEEILDEFKAALDEIDPEDFREEDPPG